ncbi:hypothetical protein [Kribbella sp. DT2]|uniref:hypothetical protein n=1 Tax=Kribbella sp. DT2 TaxID=3393427 RepID=UPI003CEEEC00
MPTQLLSPAAVGRANDGTLVFHTGVWLSPGGKSLFVGVVAEGRAAERYRRPSITIDDGKGLKINSFAFIGGAGPGCGHTWLLQAEVNAKDASRLSGATLVMRYEDLALDYSARLADLTEQ